MSNNKWIFLTMLTVVASMAITAKNGCDAAEPVPALHGGDKPDTPNADTVPLDEQMFGASVKVGHYYEVTKHIHYLPQKLDYWDFMDYSRAGDKDGINDMYKQGKWTVGPTGDVLLVISKEDLGHYGVRCRCRIYREGKPAGEIYTAEELFKHGFVKEVVKPNEQKPKD